MTDMHVEVDAGLYVVAVSGGVDSVVLLDVLAKMPNITVVIAHYDHGIRDDALLDRQYVARLAKQYGVGFVYDTGKLGAQASEALAREKRYAFLHKVRVATGARGIITAHHQDDVIETALLNMLRGTHRKGLSSLRSRDGLYRPLLHTPKQQLIAYARANGLVWREDSTNADTRYKRNYVRHTLVPKMDAAQRKQLLQYIRQMYRYNEEIDELLHMYMRHQPSINRLWRQSFIQLPHIVSSEVMAAWLRQNNIGQIDRRLIDRLVIAAKTYRTGQRATVNRQRDMCVCGDTIDVQPRHT